MKKNVKIVTLILFLFLGIKINVNADYAYCYYGYSPEDDDFLIRKSGFCLVNCNKRASLIMQIAYDDTRDELKHPKFIGRIIEEKDANFSDGYEKEFKKDTNNESIDCLPTNTTCSNDLPPINLKNIQDNNGKLMCPDVYLYKSINTNPADGSKSSTWTISLDPDAESLYGKKFDKKYTVAPDLSYSKISNTSKSEDPEQENNTKKVTTCNYKYENYALTGYIHGSGTVGFSIYEDGTVNEITSTGNTLNGQNFVFDGTIGDLKGPPALSFKSTISTFYIKTCSSSKCDAYYDGDIHSGEDNKFALSYISLKNAEKTITITVDNTGFKASF